MTYFEKMWTFKTANIEIRWEIAPEDHIDLSWDETGETAENLKSGLWLCFVSRMQAIHIPTGAVLAEDYLGQSIYEKPCEFRDHIGARGKYGSYFKDMVLTVCQEARKTLATMQSIPLRKGA